MDPVSSSPDTLDARELRDALTAFARGDFSARLPEGQEGAAGEAAFGGVSAPYACLWAPAGIHPDQHAIIVNPSNPTQIFNGSDGGVVRTDGIEEGVEHRGRLSYAGPPRPQTNPKECRRGPRPAITLRRRLPEQSQLQPILWATRFLG